MGKSTIFDKAMDYIDDHIELTKQEIRVGLYGYLRYDTTKISAFITILTGSSTLDQYITSRKLYFAALELENNSDKKVTEIGQKYYSESSSFSRGIKRQYGYSPKQIRDEKPPIPDNRLTIEDYIDKPTSYLAKVLDHYQNDDFSQSGCLEDDYLESFVEATNEYGFSTETCCLISMLSYHMNIPFAYMLEKCFDMVIDIHYYQRYNKVLQDRGLMDYDDQIIYAYIILGKYPDILKYYRDKYKFISVDEAQDTSKRQHAVIRLLVGENNIFMVGDEDQSIYGFRGAYPEALMRFRDDYANPFIMYMERNYRSTQEIVCAAQKFIEKNRKRHPKHMVSNRGKGEPIERIVVASRQEQYSYLVNDLRKNDGRTAILYRDNECAVPLIDLLIRSNIPYYTLQDQNSFFSSRTVIDMIAFLKLSINPYDTKSFMQIYYKCGMRLKKQFALDVCNLSKKNHITLTDALINLSLEDQRIKSNIQIFSNNMVTVSKKSTHDAISYIYDRMYKFYLQSSKIEDSGKINLLKSLALLEPGIKNFLLRIERLPNMIKSNSRKNDQSIALSTIHSSKGLEFDRVYLLDVFDGCIPKAKYNEILCSKKELKEYQEDRRLFYVAMTRAKNKLCIFDICGNTPYSKSFIREVLPYGSSNLEANQYIQNPINGISFEAFQGYKQYEPYKHNEQMRLESERIRRENYERKMLEDAARKENEEKQRLWLKEIQDNPQLFDQQETRIIDSDGNRWLKCEECGAVKLEPQFPEHGGPGRLNLGICKECSRKH